MTAQNEKRVKTEEEATKGTDLLDMLRTLFRWKKLIIGACLVAGIGSAVIVLLLPEYYQSTTVFFATSPDQATPELLFGDGASAPQLYGNENDIDRMLTISESNELIDFLVDTFDLYTYYDIDPDSPKGKHYVRRHFMGLYDVTKTKRDAIQLSIEDKDPEFARTITRTTRNKIDELTQLMIKDGQERAIATFENNINSKSEQIAVLSDTLQSLRDYYGIFNTEAQSESLTALAASTETDLISAQAKLGAYREKRIRDSVTVYEVKVAGLEEEMLQLNNKLNKFSEGLAQVLTFTRQYQEANSSLSEDKEKLKQYKATYDSEIPAMIVVEEAMLPVVKSRPFRTLIVLAAVFITFFFTIVGILLHEAYGDIDWKAIYRGE
ncbi:MAG: Wzz/FepE/Etk N-terminal domain-containing protein [Bacteroidota bacterium]